MILKRMVTQKWCKSDSKVTQKWLPGSHPKATPSDSKWGPEWLWSQFWVTLGSVRQSHSWPFFGSHAHFTTFVHKLFLPLPWDKCQPWGFSTDFVQYFSYFGPFSRGGGETKLADKNFKAIRTFLKLAEEKKAHKHKLFALVRVWSTPGQPAG